MNSNFGKISSIILFVLFWLSALFYQFSFLFPSVTWLSSVTMPFSKLNPNSYSYFAPVGKTEYQLKLIIGKAEMREEIYEPLLQQKHNEPWNTKVFYEEQFVSQSMYMLHAFDYYHYGENAKKIWHDLPEKQLRNFIELKYKKQISNKEFSFEIIEKPVLSDLIWEENLKSRSVYVSPKFNVDDDK